MNMVIMAEAFQRAVVSRLQANAALMAMISGVYDDVPEQTPLPYVTIATSSLRNQGVRHISTVKVTCALNIWSAYAGKKESFTIMKQIETLLSKNVMTLTSGRIISLSLIRQEVAADVRASLQRGEMLYEALLENIT